MPPTTANNPIVQLPTPIEYAFRKLRTTSQGEPLRPLQVAADIQRFRALANGADQDGAS